MTVNRNVMLSVTAVNSYPWSNTTLILVHNTVRLRAAAAVYPKTNQAVGPKQLTYSHFQGRRNTLVCTKILPPPLLFLLLFFHWHYSPLWALACRTMSFHFFLSATKSLHLLTPSIWRSLSTSSFHPFMGLPLFLVPSGSWVKIFLGILFSSTLSRWPNQLILCPFIHFTIFPPLLISYKNTINLILDDSEIDTHSVRYTFVYTNLRLAKCHLFEHWNH